MSFRMLQGVLVVIERLAAHSIVEGRKLRTSRRPTFGTRSSDAKHLSSQRTYKLDVNSIVGLKIL